MIKLNFKQAEIVDVNENGTKLSLVVPIVKPETKKSELKFSGSLNVKKQLVSIKGADLKMVDVLQYKKVENLLVKRLLDGTAIKKSKIQIDTAFAASGSIE